jgi:hypothetical protein
MGRTIRREKAVQLLCGFLLFAAQLAFAAEHHGLVLFDGLPVPGATVTVAQGTKEQSTITDRQGLYEFADLPEGNWKIRIEMQGFSTLNGDIVVSPTTPQSSWQLKMLGLEQLLAKAREIKPEGIPLQPRLTTDNKAPVKSNEPPLPEAPRPTEEATDHASDGLLINGSVNNAATSRYTLSPAFGNRRAGAKSLYTGGIGVIVDNSIFDARPYSLAGISTPKASYSQVTMIATLGGPLNIPHLLPRGPNFFLAYQWTRDSNATTIPGLVPDEAERRGDLSGLLNSAGQPVTIYNPATGMPYQGLIPVNPQASALLNLYPLPNLAGNTRYNYQTAVLSSKHADALQSRLDKTIGRRDQLYGRFGFQSSRANNANLFQFRDTTNTLGIDTSINWSHLYRHQLFVNLGYHFTRLRTDIRPYFANDQNISGNAGITGNSQAPSDWGPPTLAFSSGITSLTDGISTFNRNRTDAFSVSVSSTRGHHNVIFGGDYRKQEFNELTQQNPRGVFTFTGTATQGSTDTGSGSDLADFLLGVPDTSQLAFGNPDKYFRQPVYDLYVNDDWRIRPELTINAGLRWDYGAPLTELFGRLVNLDLTSGFSAARPVLANDPIGPVTGQRYPGSLIRPDKFSVEPRLGIAWRPLPASTMVVRAGYGVYDDTSVYLSAAETMAQQSPLSKSLNVANGSTCPLTLANGFINCSGITSNTFAVDPNLRVGYAQTWQLSIQKDLPGAMVMTATYLGVKGTRGMQLSLPNTYAPGTANPCSTCPVGFTYRTSNGNSTRESAQLQLRRRLRSGFTATLQYTYSKSLDNDAQVGAQGHQAATSTTAAPTTITTAQQSEPMASPSVAQNWLDLRAERGLSNFDQRHLLKVQMQYTTGMGMHGGTLLGGWRGTLLKEWTLMSQINAGTGLPETPIYLTPLPGVGVPGTIRPDLTGQPIYRASAGYFLNAGAYTAPAAGNWGTSRRNSITGPSQFTLDASALRTFRLRDPLNLDIRLDATNLFNHVVFTTWNSTVNSTTFGLPVATNPMRSMQLTARLRF